MANNMTIAKTHALSGRLIGLYLVPVFALVRVIDLWRVRAGWMLKSKEGR